MGSLSNDITVSLRINYPPLIRVFTKHYFILEGCILENDSNNKDFIYFKIISKLIFLDSSLNKNSRNQLVK